MPLRVLFVACDRPGSATYRYRNENIATALRESGAAVDVAYVGQARVRVHHDIVVLHRICRTREGRAFAAAARRCGATLVYSADDLVFEPETAYHVGFSRPGNPELYRHYRSFVESNREMMRGADAVLVSTEFLAERARDAVPGKPVFVVRNFLSDDLIALSDDARRGQAMLRTHAGQRLTLGYLSGTPTHDMDLADIAEPLRRVLLRHEDVNLLLVGAVGLPPGMDDVASRVRRHPFVPWRDLPALLAGIDINLAPLDPTRAFNHAKSEIKLLEAAAAGVPTVAAATAGFREVVRNGENGFLCESRADWESRLEALITSAESRAAAGDRALRYALAHATVSAHANGVAGVFDDLATLSAERRAETTAGSTVNWPVAPKYVVKAAERRIWSVLSRVRSRGRAASDGV